MLGLKLIHVSKRGHLCNCLACWGPNKMFSTWSPIFFLSENALLQFEYFWDWTRFHERCNYTEAQTALLSVCVGKPPTIDGFPHKTEASNADLNKLSSFWWFQTHYRSCDFTVIWKTCLNWFDCGFIQNTTCGMFFTILHSQYHEQQQHHIRLATVNRLMPFWCKLQLSIRLVFSYDFIHHLTLVLI